MTYITATGSDRIGMQIYRRLWTACFAAAEGIQYVHTPIGEPYESVFNLGRNYPNISDVDPNKVTIFNEKQTNFQPIVRRGFFADFSGEVVSSILKNYDPQATPVHNKTTIAIHVRRDDILAPEYAKSQPVLLRHTTDQQLQTIFDNIHSLIKTPCITSIHTDGEIQISNFNTHGIPTTVYGRDTPALMAMQDMIAADILFPSGISGFSGVAGIYNKNLVIDLELNERPLPYSKLYLQKNRKTIQALCQL